MKQFIVAVLLLAFYFSLPAQTVITDTIKSSLLRRDIPVTVITPRDFDSSKPHIVFYLLHYWDGDNTAYIDMNLLSSLDNKPVIVVTPAMGNGWYINSNADDGERQLDFIEQELFNHIDNKYRTIKNRQAIGGSSMGGYGAMLIGLRNPDRFCFVADLSGAVNAPFRDVVPDKYLEPVMGNIAVQFGDNPENDVMKIVRESSASELPYIFMAIGTHDEFKTFKEAHCELVRILENKKAAHEFHEIYGGHFTGEVRWAVMPYIINYLRDLILQP